MYSETPKPIRKSIMQQYSSVISMIKNILSNMKYASLIVIILTTIIIILSMIDHFSTNNIAIKAYSVPKTLRDRGWAENVISAKVKEEIDRVISVANSEKSTFNTLDEIRQFDVHLPGVDYTLWSATSAILEFFGIWQADARIDILCPTQECSMKFSSHVRINDWSGEVSTFTDNGGVEKLVQEIAIGIIKNLDPYIYGYYSLNIGEFDDAIYIAKYVVKSNKFDDHWGYNLWGLALRAQGAHSQASLKFQRSIDSDPSFLFPYINDGLNLFETDEHDRAFERFREAEAATPLDARALFNWGTLLFKAGYHEEALKKFKAALAFDHANAATHNGIGVVYKKQGKNEMAIAHFEEALTYDDDHLNAYVNLIQVGSSDEHDHDAAELFDLAELIEPKTHLYHFEHGLFLAKHGLKDDAWAAYYKAKELDEDNVSTQLLKITVLFMDGNAEMAIEEIEDLLKIDENNMIAYTFWAQILEGQNKTKEALEKRKIMFHNYLKMNDLEKAEIQLSKMKNLGADSDLIEYLQTTMHAKNEDLFEER